MVLIAKGKSTESVLNAYCGSSVVKITGFGVRRPGLAFGSHSLRGSAFSSLSVLIYKMQIEN